jgi:hypothetical protein
VITGTLEPVKNMTALIYLGLYRNFLEGMNAYAWSSSCVSIHPGYNLVWGLAWVFILHVVLSALVEFDCVFFIFFFFVVRIFCVG